MTPPLPDKRYAVLLADPPWTFQTYSDKGKGRSAERHYPCMSRLELRTTPVGSIASRSCVLLLWTTMPMLEQALSLMEWWGFEYKTVAFTWVKIKDGKPQIGTGYWTRANAELCLLGTRGHPRRIAKDVSQIILAPRREHSRKPGEAYSRIDRLLGTDGPRIELFARPPHPQGWDVWGLDAQP